MAGLLAKIQRPSITELVLNEKQKREGLNVHTKDTDPNKE